MLHDLAQDAQVSQRALLIDEVSAASLQTLTRVRELAERLEAEGKDASRISIRITAWKRRPE